MNNGSRQSRLRLQVALKVRRSLRLEIARQLIDVGPICEFYAPRLTREWHSAAAQADGDNCSASTSALAQFPYVCEIVRREDRVQTELPRELNRYVPASGFYYSPIPLVPHEDNDYLALDTLLSKMEELWRATPADAGILDKVLVGDEHVLILRVAKLIAPSERLADHVADKSEGPTRVVGEAHVKELIRGVRGVAGGEGKSPESARTLFSAGVPVGRNGRAGVMIAQGHGGLGVNHHGERIR